MATSKKQQLTIEGRQLQLSNLDKILYPGGRVTKADVIDYYIRISPLLIPHVKNRPVTLKRFPEGVHGEFFYEKDAPAFTPDWVKTFPVPRKESPGPDIRYILINDIATLVWLANLANLEIHPFLHRVTHLTRPTAIVFDCDPGEGADVLSCSRVALILRDVLKDLGLKSFVKVSGSKGVQVYVPLNSTTSYEVTQPFAKAIAELLSEREPKLIVSKMTKALRRNRVFIDWSQNADFKTTVGVYSLRAKTHRPYVSLPVTWEELERAVKKENSKSLYFKPEDALARIEDVGDLFAPVLALKQKVPREVVKTLQPREELPEGKRENGRRSISRPIRRSRQGSRRRFVVQKHATRPSHYELCLEIHGVLKCWELAKISAHQHGTRAAVLTDDQSIEGLEFQGTINAGEHRGEGVTVWDIGTYELLEGSYSSGLLNVFLNGGKLHGAWSLRRGLGKQRSTWQFHKD